VERFSSALYELADAEKSIDGIEQELQQIKQAANQNADFKTLLRSPVLKRAEQQKAVASILEKAGASKLMQKFMGVLAQTRRLYLVEGIAQRFTEMLREKRGEVTAQVTSAHTLSEDQKSLLAKTLSDRLGGRKIQLDVSVNPDILGGIIVRVGSMQIDDSLKTKLNNMALTLKGV
jgi:F-type H+-transporting ATPase subunit delta